MLKKLLSAAAVALIGLPGAALAVVYATQEAAIFPAPDRDPAMIEARAAAVGAHTFLLPTSDGEMLLAWHTPAGGERAVLHFHGNASWCVPNETYRLMLAEAGWDYLCAAYRGYPGSTGSPTEAGLHLDSRALWRYAVDDLELAPSRIVLHGRSLGGGVAANLAAEVDAGGLVLESTFRSVRSLAGATYPAPVVSLLLKHPFDTDTLVSTIDESTLVLHGDLDTVIGVDHGRWLGEHLPNATYLEATGHGHNSALLTEHAEAKDAFEDFLDSRRPVPAVPAVHP